MTALVGREKWKPSVGDKFFYIDAYLGHDHPEFEVKSVFFEDWMDDLNCFQTKAEARTALNKIKKILRGA